MTHWIHAGDDTNCGNCRTPIAKGDPALVITIGASSRLRCVTCAERGYSEQPGVIVDATSPSVPIHAAQQQPLGWSSVQDIRAETPTRAAFLAFVRPPGGRQ